MNLSNAFSVKNDKWIFLEDKKIYFANLNFFGFEVQQEIIFNEKLCSIFLDVNIKREFLCFLSEFNNIIVLKNKRSSN